MCKIFNITVDLKEKTMKLPNGCTLTSWEASDITDAYERMCTAEYIQSMHPRYSQKKAWNLACKVRDLMNKYGYTEDDAIWEASKHRQTQ